MGTRQPPDERNKEQGPPLASAEDTLVKVFVACGPDGPSEPGPMQAAHGGPQHLLGCLITCPQQVKQMS